MSDVIVLFIVESCWFFFRQIQLKVSHGDPARQENPVGHLARNSDVYMTLLHSSHLETKLFVPKDPHPRLNVTFISNIHVSSNQAAPLALSFLTWPAQTAIKQLSITY